MVENQSRITKIISRYRQELDKNGIRVTGIYLYGSYARGTAHEGSDIDLVVVSPDFEEMNTRERLELLGLASARILEPIHAFGISPEELEKPDLDSFLADILKREAVPV